MGYRNSHRLTAQGRRGAAPHGIGYPNLPANTINHGRTRQPAIPVPPPGFRPPKRAVVPVRPRQGNWFTNGGWYPLVTLPTLGLLSFIPFANAARKLHRGSVRIYGIGYTILPFVWSYMLVAGTDSAGNPTNPLLVALSYVVLLGGLAAGTSHLIMLSRQIEARRAVRVEWQPVEQKPAPKVDQALAKALDARERRAQARELLATDPRLADDLGIGRPDLGLGYDDGGLVDINSAPAATIASVCHLEPAQGQAIVERREERDGFANVDEMLVLVDLPVTVWDRVRDHAITPMA